MLRHKSRIIQKEELFRSMVKYSDCVLSVEDNDLPCLSSTNVNLVITTSFDQATNGGLHGLSILKYVVTLLVVDARHSNTRIR